MMIYVCSATSIEINQEGLRFKKTEKLMVGFQPTAGIRVLSIIHIWLLLYIMNDIPI